MFEYCLFVCFGLLCIILTLFRWGCNWLRLVVLVFSVCKCLYGLLCDCWFVVWVA